MKIIVLGASGFIGRNMASYFQALGHEVHRVGFTRAEYSYPGTNWKKADLRTPFDFTGYDVVIHAAATTSGSKDIVSNPGLHVCDNAVMGSYIFRAAVEAKVKHVIFFSCTVMYPDGVCTEITPPDPHPKYFGVASTKLYLESMCKFYAGDTKFTAIRHSNIYGPHDKFDLEKSHVFGATVEKVMRSEDAVKVWGTGEEKRDFLYVDDLCEFVKIVLDKQAAPFELFNCGYGISFSVKSLVEKIIAYSGKNLSIEHDTTAPTIPTSLTLDCTKAKNLGWNPMTTLPDGIKKTVEWWRENAC